MYMLHASFFSFSIVDASSEFCLVICFEYPLGYQLNVIIYNNRVIYNNNNNNNNNNIIIIRIIINNNCPRGVFGPRGPKTRGGTLGLPT